MNYSNSTDEGIIDEAARARASMNLPVIQIPLFSFDNQQPNVAEVDFRSDPPGVRRFRRNYGLISFVVGWG